MLRTLRLLAISTVLIATAGAALAETNGEVPPSCPGGGTATGTFSCTGPVLKPVCTEGPPWKCSVSNTATTLELSSSDVVPPKKHHFNVTAQFNSLSESGTDTGAGTGMPSAPVVVIY